MTIGDLFDCLSEIWMHRGDAPYNGYLARVLASALASDRDTDLIQRRQTSQLHTHLQIFRHLRCTQTRTSASRRAFVCRLQNTHASTTLIEMISNAIQRVQHMSHCCPQRAVHGSCTRTLRNSNTFRTKVSVQERDVCQLSAVARPAST